MNLRNINEILVPDNRQRREFDEQALDSLAQSIVSKGLFHPIVLGNDGYTLVAGERRLRAITRLHEAGTPYNYNDRSIPPGQIPFTLLGELDPLLLREAELEENVIRRDLTWQEHSAAVKELHDLRTEQAAANGRPQTVKDTASEILGRVALGSQSQAISDSLRIAEHLNDPDVAAARSEKEALKVIERKAATAHRERLAEAFGELESEHTLIHGDAFSELPKLPDASVDIILTDPPYGVFADEFGDQAGARHTYQDDVDFAFRCYETIFIQAERLSRPDAFIFAFCDIRLFPYLLDLGGKASPSFSFWETPLIWNKGNGMLPVPTSGPRRNYEAILYAYRGSRPWVTTGSSDVFEIPALGRPIFGAQKPPELYRQLLSRVARPGDVVLDPFAGTGPVIPAAGDNSCRAIAIELDRDKVNYAKTEYLNA